MINKIFALLSVIIYMLGVESTTSARPFLLGAGLAGGCICAIVAGIKESIKENKKNKKQLDNNYKI